MAQSLKNLSEMQEKMGSIPGSGRSPGEGNGNPLQYSCLANSMDRGAWQSTVHGEVEEPGGLESMEKSMDRRACEARELGVAEPDRTALLLLPFQMGTQ